MLIDLTHIFLIFVLSLSAYGIALAWYMIRIEYDFLYEKTDFRPFNCRLCLTYWIDLLLLIIFGFGIYSVLFAFVGFAIADFLIKLEDGG